MLVSDSRRFVFIKTRKTAGTTLEIVLSAYCSGKNDVLTPFGPRDEEAGRIAYSGVAPRNYKFTAGEWLTLPWMISRQRRLFRVFDRRTFTQRFWNHADARTAQARLPAKQWDYLKFCVERDPWEKLVSCYYFFLHYFNRKEADWSFGDFFEDGWAEWLSDYMRYSADGKFLVDRIINFDRLGEGLALIRGELGIEEPLEEALPNVVAKKTPEGKKKPLAELFNDELERRARCLFAREIETFGFRTSPHSPKDAKAPFLFTNGRQVI